MNTSTIKVLIVDDEPFARKYIREMLGGQDDIEVIGEAGNGKVAMRAIAKNKPDLMFLDIQMPEMDGFALLQSLGSDELPVIIFTTAYEEYAIRAFEVHAVDYLLKPFDQQRFSRSLEHARHLLTESSSRIEESGQISELIRAIREKPKFLERLLVKRNGRIIFLKISQIDWIKADDKYIHLHGEGVRHMIRQTLASIKSQLDPSQFVQLNRSVIVNVDSIKELHPMFNGDHEVQIRDGSKFTLSRNHRSELFDLLGKPMS
jgi:two-component system LytT family response regulator